MSIHIKEIFRSAKRNLVTTVLSISGMAIALTIAIIIGYWGVNEFSFDQFHKDKNQIYRICRQGVINGESVSIGSDFGPVATTSRDRFPEIESVCRVVKEERELFKIKDLTFYQNDICIVDPNFFSFFTFQIERGDATTCLDSPDKIVISQKMADQYFANTDPIGQIISFRGQSYQVSAIMRNPPENSHLQFNAIAPISSIRYLRECGWGETDNFISYLKLKEGTNVESLAKRITSLTYEFFPIYKQYHITHFLQPLTDIHFSSGFRFDFVKTNDRRIIIIFISMAALILIISSFNFINIFISTSFLRAKSIGIKKISGISRLNFFLFSYLETSFYILTAALIAGLLAFLLLPVFNQLADTQLTFNTLNADFIVFLVLLLLFTIVFAGTFPVFFILRLKANTLIRSQFKGSSVSLTQKILVISQFAASIILICSSVTIKKQIYFIQHKELGFNKDQIIYLNAKNFASNYELVKEELLRNPNIIDVTVKSSLPTVWNNGNPISNPDDPSRECLMENCQIAANYPEMMKMSLVEGSNPFVSGRFNPKECMINEKAAKALGLTNPIGRQIRTSDYGDLTVAGVLKDVNTKSLHLAVDPQVYRLIDQVRGFHCIFVKTNGNNADCIQAIHEQWGKYNPDIPFEYSFLDDAYDKMYKNEKVASKVITLGVIVAIFLAFIGLFAISQYTIDRRTKEIGIRKVNGANVSELLVLMNKDFLKWVMIAFLVSIPLAFLIMHHWLENFAYKTELSWWIFVSGGILALLIAVFTVSWQSYKAATRNPVEALRYE